METSQTILYHGLTFLAVSTGLIIVVIGVFLAIFIKNLTKLTKNLDETTTIVNSELKPTLDEFKDALKSINSIAQTADKQVDSLAKIMENVIGVSTLAYARAKKLSGGLLKGFVQGVIAMVKLFIKK